MRPVRLDIDGFASFREPAHLDLSEVDYFALVGSTGAGKSTLIDAMTFALYGTVHRWEHASSVRHALAPTTNRATVSLVFDVGGQRYQVVREVRRAPGSGNVTQRSARLERFVDPTACPAPGEETPTESIAAEVRHVTPAVERLLGLDFADFCQCVVLPQGQFAAFLKAKPGERQDILLKLLGASHYERIGKAAGVRARDAQQRVSVHQQALGRLAHATPEALASARARETDLEALVASVGDLVAPVLDAREQADAAATRATDDARAADVLETVVAPGGLAERGDALREAREAVEVATSAAESAQAVATAAEAAVTAGPRRHVLDQAARDHARHRQLTADLAAVAEELAAATEAEQALALEAEEARARAVAARGADRAAEEAHAAAVTALDQVTARLGRLDAVRQPDGLAERAAQVLDARAAVEQAQEAATAARDAVEAHATGPALPRDDELDEAAASIVVARGLVRAAHDAAAATAAAADRARAEEAEAVRLEVEAAEAEARVLEGRRTSHAAALRPDLQVGHPCPVCEQAVTVLPPPTDVSASVAGADDRARSTLERARTARTAATASAQAAGAAEHEARLRAEAADAAVPRVGAAVGRLAARCGVVAEVAAATDPATDPGVDPGVDPGAALDAAAALLGRVREAVADADRVRSDLVRRRTDADAALVVAEDGLARAHAAVRSAHRLLVTAHATVVADAPGAPAPPGDDVTDADVVGGWAALVDWLRSEVGRLRADDLPAAEESERTTRRTHDDASTGLSAAEDALTAAGAAATAAAVRAATARSSRDGTASSLTELAAALADAPAEDLLPGLVAESERLAADHQQARDGLAAAQGALRAARARHEAARAAVVADRDALTASRDRAAAWQPPSFSSTRVDDDLDGCWAELAAWAAAEAATRRTASAGSDRSAEAHAATAVAALDALRAALRAHGVDDAAVEAAPGRAETLAEVALGDARRDAAGLAADVAAAASTQAAIEADTVTAQVAEQLRTMMRSDRFPEWLATAALDTLVVGASESLRGLSDGQFSLVHDGGDFFVIDHFDADSTRTVKTLSGGETFQASLALALALSEQLATLAAGGTSRLESLFLDEGFGTLDPESLDMVAATLENLSRGNRLVGVVTHVAALADNIPVRFRVTNDQQTSRVEPEPAG